MIMTDGSASVEESVEEVAKTPLDGIIAENFVQSDDDTSGDDGDEVEAAEVEEPEEGESTDDESTEEPDESTPDSTEEEKSSKELLKEINGLKSALSAVREKSREKEAELAEKQKEPTPDVFEDQQAFVDSLKSEIRNEVLSAKVSVSQGILKELKDDYDEVEQRFHKMMADNPELAEAVAPKLRESDAPALYAYNFVKEQEALNELKALGSSEVREKMKAELLKEIEEEQASQSKKQASKRAAVTPSLAKTRSVSGKNQGSDDVFKELFK